METTSEKTALARIGADTRKIVCLYMFAAFYALAASAAASFILASPFYLCKFWKKQTNINLASKFPY